MTTPFDKLEAQYAAHPREEPFANYVMHYHRIGFVFSRPDFVVFGRPVIRSAPHDQIKDPRFIFKSEDCDCWYLHAASGNMARMWAVVPFRLPWFCWTRINDPLGELTFCQTETLKRLCPPDIHSLENVAVLTH